MIERTEALKKWVRQVPASRLDYPSRLKERAKFLFWRFITPLHNPTRDLLLSAGMLKHHGRQKYLLGTLASGTTLERLVEHLLSEGWGNHFIAWEDDGQVISLRRTVSFKHQYHLRIFEDGEVRGHFEYTPESHMVLHMKEVGMEERREEFLTLLSGHIVPAQGTETDFSWSFLRISQRQSA